MENGLLGRYRHLIAHSKFKCRALFLLYGLRQRVVWLVVTCGTYQSLQWHKLDHIVKLIT